MNWADIGLLAVLAIPVAVVVAMIVLPSDHDDPPSD